MIARVAERLGCLPLSDPIDGDAFFADAGRVKSLSDDTMQNP
ncbi:hypothetical protein [Cryobacterium flavum]|nr:MULTISPECIES: hypothetical protein [Cryobacterium]